MAKKIRSTECARITVALFLVFMLFWLQSSAVFAGEADSISVVSVDNASGKAQIEISGVKLSPDMNNLVVPVWSRKDQGDLIWYTPEKAGEGRYVLQLDIARHGGNYGTYYVDVYETGSAGTGGYLGGTTAVFSVPVERGTTAVKKNGPAGTYQLTTTGFSVPKEIRRAVYAVWSEEGGQDDLTWVTASVDPDSSFMQGTLKDSSFLHTGNVFADAYAELADGTMCYVGGTSFRHSGNACQSLTVENRNEASGTCSIVLKGVSAPSGVSEILIPVWSTADQSDIYWYRARQESADVWITQMDLANHTGNTGSFYADAYVTDGTGAQEFLASGTVTFENTEKTEKPSANQNADKAIQIKTDREKGSFTVTVDAKYTDASVRSVVIPVWSTADQSDLVWYEAKKNSQGNYEISSDISRHGYHTGTYYADVYTRDEAGNMRYAGGKTMDFKISDDGVSCTGKDGRNYQLTVKKLTVPGGVQGVSFAVWSEKDGQDDLTWYPASGKNGGDFTASVDVAKHKTEGQYLIDPYVQTMDGKMVCLGTCRDLVVKAEADADITVTDKDEDAGTFQVKIKLSNLSCPVEAVTVPVWSLDDQSDIHWYKAKNTGGDTWEFTADVRNHKNNTGLFHIDVYGDFANGLFKFIGGKNQYFDPDASLTVSSPDGTSRRRVTFRSKAADSVSFAVWTKTGGQDDIIWYKAEEEEDGSGVYYADIPAENHSHNGTYIVHVYVTGGDEQFYAGGTTFSMIDYVEYAIGLANDDSHGYSQVNRCMNPDLDCSSLVYYSLYNSGFGDILGPSPFYTGTEIYLLQKCGFVTLEYTGMEDLKPGDILWFRYGTHGHTEIYVGDGKNVGAHDSVVDGVDYPEGGDQTGREVSVSDFYQGHEWIYVLRYYE